MEVRPCKINKSRTAQQETKSVQGVCEELKTIRSLQVTEDGVQTEGRNTEYVLQN